MTKSRTTIVTDHLAYDLGRSGIVVNAPYLLHYMRAHNAHALGVREKILARQINGAGSQLHSLIAVLFGLAIFAAALYVDFQIINEFWVRALANEFLDNVNATLLASAEAKSLQVLFATLAIHYLLTYIGHTGRKVYVVIVALLAGFMVLALGTLWAKGTGVVEDPSGILCKLRGAADCAEGLLPSWMGKDEFFGLIALSTLFLIVASVGALGLHGAIRGFTSLSGGTLLDDHDDAVHNNRARNELASVRACRHALADNDANGAALHQQKLPEFVASYTAGILDRRFASDRSNQLLAAVTAAADEVGAQLSPMSFGTDARSSGIRRVA
jgi:hypothetical protein